MNSFSMLRKISVQSQRRNRVFLSALLTALFLNSTANAQMRTSCVSLFQNSNRRLSPEIEKFESVFKTTNPIIGMIHLAGKDDAVVVQRALRELRLFERMGVHAAIIENYHGSLRQVELVLRAAQNQFKKIVLGVNVLPNEFQWAFFLSRKYGARFIQLDFISGRYEDGELPPFSLDLFEYEKYRRVYSDVLVLGGVHPKYYVPVLGSDLQADINAAKQRADAIVVTGEGTGMATPLEKILEFRRRIGSRFPLVIGAGVTAENARTQLSIGNGAIIGSYIKNGDTRKPVSPLKLLEIMKITKSLEAEK